MLCACAVDIDRFKRKQDWFLDDCIYVYLAIILKYDCYEIIMKSWIQEAICPVFDLLCGFLIHKINFNYHVRHNGVSKKICISFHQVCSDFEIHMLLCSSFN